MNKLALGLVILGFNMIVSIFGAAITIILYILGALTAWILPLAFTVYAFAINIAGYKLERKWDKP